MREFFAALAIPMTTAVALVVSALVFGVHGPVVALILNAFLVSEVAGFSQVFALPMPERYFRLRSLEHESVYEALGIKAFKRLMRSAWMMLFNILFNAYPVMLQRYNRRRLQRVLMYARR